MQRVLITGMSGTGKSTAIHGLTACGVRAVDTDSDHWCEWVRDETGEPDWIWREDRIAALLDADDAREVFLSGCRTNQGRFRHRFDHVVLLHAPTPVLLDRLASRTTNPYGRSAADRARILEHVANVEPLLRASADVRIDTAAATGDEVVARLLTLVGRPIDRP